MAESEPSETPPGATAAASEEQASTSSAKSPMTPQEIANKIMERVHKAETYKTDGNECYKNKDIKTAIGKYHRALLYVKGLDSMAQQDIVQRVIGVGRGFNSDGPQNFGDIIGKLLPEDIETIVSGIQQGCYNNLAACLLQQEKPNYEKVITYCDKVLDLSPQNAKALYRKGQSLYHVQDYDKALSSLKKAREQAKSDPNIKKYISLCEARLADQNQKQKTCYKAMFDKIAQGEEEDNTNSTGDAPLSTAEPS